MNAPAMSDSGRRCNRSLVGVYTVTLLLPLLLTSSGCRANKNYDLIEAELRTRERELAETRVALDQSRILNRAYDQAQRSESPNSPSNQSLSSIPPYSIREITLGRGTGGVDEDDSPGDESLMVVVVPTDEDRSAVKVPARLTIAAWEINSQGLKSPIGLWEVSPEKLRATWRSGLLASGYFVSLPWQNYPSKNKVRVAVRLTTLDNRSFEADRDITVRPIASPSPRSTPPLSSDVPGVYPSTPVMPSPAREPLLPDQRPAKPLQILPSGIEELPPPAGLGPDRPAKLLPPGS